MRTIGSLWRHVNYCKQSHDNFWPTLASFIATILQPHFIRHINLDNIYNMMTEYTLKLLELGNSQQGVSNYFLSQFESVWIEKLVESDQSNPLHKNTKNYIEMVMRRACIHGSSYRKDITYGSV